MDPKLVKNKFKGALLGGLVGDCLGSPFEQLAGPSLSQSKREEQNARLKNFFQEIFEPEEATYYRYTDDTEMAKATAQSLIAMKGFDPAHLAKSLVDEFYDASGLGGPTRYYGPGTLEVLKEFRIRGHYLNPYAPAQDLNDGRGSYGNGAAMRVAPAALFAYHKKPEDSDFFVRIVYCSSVITHSHKGGYRGALLLAFAIKEALKLEPVGEIDQLGFTQTLMDKMRELEGNDSSEETANAKVSSKYVDKLETMKRLLISAEQPSVPQVQAKLGNGATAIDSVVTAIYCFLVSQKPILGIKGNSTFHRCIQYAISLGGDTDTIACMAGYVAGAYLGLEAIPYSFLISCEGSCTISQLAEKLYQVSMPDAN